MNIRVLKSIVKFIRLVPKRIVELLEMAVDVLSEAVSGGGVMALKYRIARRLEICRNCDRLEEDGTCGICTCYMTIKTKFKAAKCPEGRW